MAYAQYLTEQVTQTTDEGTKKLIDIIQLALLGGKRSQLGQELNGVYRQAWEAIISETEAEAETET